MRDNDGCGAFCGLLYLITIVVSASCYGFKSFITFLQKSISEASHGDYCNLSICFGIVAIAVIAVMAMISYWIYNKQKNKCENKIELIESEHRLKEAELKRNYELKEGEFKKRENIMNKIIESKTPFKEVASMAAEIRTFIYEKDEHYLRYKAHPAHTAAQKVNSIRKACDEKLTGFFEMQFKYDFLLSSFPELEWFANHEEELVNISEFKSYSDIENNRDRCHDYISDEEWRCLTTTQRNQLALDRYIASRKKSAWAIGRDYEMACAHYLQKKGYKVSMDGIEKRFDDLGRDIIASKVKFNGLGLYLGPGEILVIQCKCSNKDRIIHENVVMQLMGTTLAFKVQSGDRIKTNIKIVPVLMIPNFTQLSETAEKFAEILNIKIMRQDCFDYPHIKCNINNGQKIYHLPFDQQYDRAMIKNEGEFYAWTVVEAEDKGFRRAMRHTW